MEYIERAWHSAEFISTVLRFSGNLSNSVPTSDPEIWGTRSRKVKE